MSLAELPPLPTTEFEVEPTAEEVEFFLENGYLVVDRITTDEELDWLTEIYEHIFDPANFDQPGSPVDRSETTDAEGIPLLLQAFMPEVRFPELLNTVAHRNGRKYAAALLQADPSALSSWGHMIRKAPGGREAPWHQDEAYWDPEIEYPNALGCWLPLHDVPVEMGAMQFVPGSHKRGVLEHHAKDGNVALHLLTIDEKVEGVACPLKKGGATFHHKNTLHYTAVNTTDQPRLAFPTEFQLAPRVRTEPRQWKWVDEFRAVTGGGKPVGWMADGKFVKFDY